jgi:hypothetical protein
MLDKLPRAGTILKHAEGVKACLKLLGKESVLESTKGKHPKRSGDKRRDQSGSDARNTGHMTEMQREGKRVRG